MRKRLSLGFGIVLIALLAACTGDPNVRKQKYLQSGNDFFVKAKYREAAIEYLNAIKLDSQLAEAHYQLAQSYIKLQIWRGAYQELLRTVDLKPDHLQAQVDLGNLMLASRQFKEAQQRAQLVLQKDPKSIPAHILLANSFAALQDLAASIDEMQAAVQLDPERAQSYLNLGYLQLNAQQAANAEASFRKAIELDTKSAGPMLALANYFTSARRLPEAEELFRQAIQKEPKAPVAYAALARLLVVQQRKDDAIQLLTEGKAAMRDVPLGYRLLGDLYVALGDADRAAAEYASLYAEHPNDVNIKKTYAQFLLVTNRVEDATRLTEEIRTANPRDIEGILLRAQILMTRKEHAEAVTLLEESLRSEVDNPILRFHLGRALGALGKLTRAETEWREALRLSPNFTAAHEALAAIATQKQDWAQLRKSADTMIQNNPNIPAGFLHRATARLASGDQAGADADLQTAVSLAPQNPIVYIHMGAFRAASKRYSEAERNFERALELDPRSTAALQALVNMYSVQEQFAKAAARANAQVTKAPGIAGHYLVLGSAYVGAKDLEHAEQAAAKAVEFSKGSTDSLVALARVQEMRNKLDQAALNYQQAMNLDPRQAMFPMFLGGLEERRSNSRRAMELYEKALQIQPNFALAANNLAFLMLEHGGNVDTALNYAQMARRGAPGLVNTADTLAWAYYRKGMYPSAIDLLLEALKAQPENPTFNYHLGMAYWKNNDKERARRYLSLAMRYKPQPALAAEIQKALNEIE